MPRTRSLRRRGGIERKPKNTIKNEKKEVQDTTKELSVLYNHIKNKNTTQYLRNKKLSKIELCDLCKKAGLTRLENKNTEQLIQELSKYLERTETRNYVMSSISKLLSAISALFSYTQYSRNYDRLKKHKKNITITNLMKEVYNPAYANEIEPSTAANIGAVMSVITAIAGFSLDKRRTKRNKQRTNILKLLSVKRGGGVDATKGRGRARRNYCKDDGW